MNTNNKVIVYDESCPLCGAYTNLFVQAGLVQKENRKNFSNLNTALFDLVDKKRGVNEIPLIDPLTGQVSYGVDALLEIFSHKLPIIKKVGNIPTVKWLLYKFYRFVSYNRRVIVATRQPANGFDCTPDFNLRYRLSFMLLFLVLNTWILFPIHQHLFDESLFSSTSIQQLQAAHMALVALNITLALSMGKKKGVEYLGQINMLAFSGTILIIPLLLINKYIYHGIVINNMYFGIVALLIINEYNRRMRFANIIPHYPIIAVTNGISIVLFVWFLIF